MRSYDCYRWAWNISDMDISDAEYSAIRAAEDEQSDFEEEHRLRMLEEMDEEEVI